ncbi:MAG: TonB-dependent receptor [Proteobacteria bacterium]|nr:TonB-dependent receptor [Pseudomonadota bacterium]
MTMQYLRGAAPVTTALAMISALAALPANRAIADEPAAGSAPTALAEIVVTAQKRSQNLQDVPLSIAAFDNRSLQETGVQDFNDLAARVPGVALNSAGPGRSSYSIRGIASIGGNAPTTGVYVDETPILPSGGDGANASIDPDLYDLARVEVLRGPQGTLYGSSSMGGTIRLITNQPELARSEGSVHAEGSYTEHGSGNVRLDGMVNLPLIQDRVALRLVGTYKNYSGFIDREVGVWAPQPADYSSSVPNPPPYPVSPAAPTRIVRNVNTEERYSLRAVMKIAVSDTLTVTPSVWMQRLNMGAPPDFDVVTGQSSGSLVQRRPFDVSEAYHDRFTLANLTVNDQLSFGSLVSSTSYMHRTVYTPDDETEALELAYPQGRFVANSYAPTVTTREFTEELRLNIAPQGSPFSGVVGAYYNDSNRHYSVWYNIPGYDALFRGSPTSLFLFGPGPLDDVNYSQHGDYSPRQEAAFAEGNYDLTQKLKLTAGLRWYRMQYDTIRNEDGLSNGGPSISTGSAVNTGVNPKLSLSYQFEHDVLAYATASRGVRPGGTNTSDLAAKGCGQDYGPYQPDSLWNYELGGKTRWLDGRLTANGAVYYIKWKDVQQGETLPCSYQITQNAGAANVTGAELELQAQITPALQVSAGAGYTHAVLAEDAPNLGGFKGQQLQNVPRWNGGASVRYAFGLASYRAFVRADYQYVGESFPDFARSDPATFQRAYSLTDLRAGVTVHDWELDLFMDNAFDKQAYLSRFISDNYDAASRSRMFTNRPRTVGLSVQRSF